MNMSEAFAFKSLAPCMPGQDLVFDKFICKALAVDHGVPG